MRRKTIPRAARELINHVTAQSSPEKNARAANALLNALSSPGLDRLPDHVIQIAQMPRSETGKMDKNRRLRGGDLDSDPPESPAIPGS